MKIVKQISSILLIFLLSNCSGINKLVTGFWTIDKIEYKNQDFLYDISANIIIFKSKVCILPHIEGLNKFEFNSEDGTWEILQNVNNTYSIKIETKNQIFTGTHQICFIKDFNNKLVKMQIRSDSIYILCSKTLVNFDKENSAFDDIICK